MSWPLLRGVPPRGSTAAPGPAGPPPPPPDEGAGARTGPPKGIAPNCCYSPPPPPPFEPADTVDPPHHPGMPLVMAATAVRNPLCPLHDLHAGALCSSHRVCAVAALFVCHPFLWGGRGGETALVAPARPLGGGVGPAPPVLRRSPPPPPARRPRGMGVGVGVDRRPLLLPPPPRGAGFNALRCG